MKSENKIFLKGKIGQDARITKVGERNVANFSMATDYDYKQSDGKWAKETTWHDVCAWQGYGICELDQLKKGTPVYVTGRIRKREFTDGQGFRKVITEVLAETIDLLLSAEKPSVSASLPKDNGKPKQDEDEF